MSKNDLAGQINAILTAYGNECIDVVKVETKSAMVKARQQLISTSPVGRGTWKGHYKNSWKNTTTQNSSSITITLHNSNKWQLAHLLEYGHAKRGGGRVRAIPHIESVRLAAEKEIESNLVRRLSNE